jgi:rhodanese-related sulfurtransferase
VETIAKIRRAYFAQNKPIKTICREFRVSRRVVRKGDPVAGDRVSLWAQQAARPRIDPWRDQLDGLLLENEGKPARERLTLIRIFEELRALGYEGSYDAVRRYAKRWRAERGAATAEAFVPLSFAPGEAYQFDWSHEIVLINGVTVTVKVAHVRLCHSRMVFVRAYPRETQEMVFDAHNRAFAFFKGACTPGTSGERPLARVCARFPVVDAQEGSACPGEGRGRQDETDPGGVRDAPELASGGKLKGVINVSRGMLEFRADPESPYHDPAFQKDKTALVYCASGGRSALSGKTLKDLGYPSVVSICV